MSDYSAEYDEFDALADYENSQAMDLEFETEQEEEFTDAYTEAYEFISEFSN